MGLMRALFGWATSIAAQERARRTIEVIGAENERARGLVDVGEVGAEDVAKSFWPLGRLAIVGNDVVSAETICGAIAACAECNGRHVAVVRRGGASNPIAYDPFVCLSPGGAAEFVRALLWGEEHVEEAAEFAGAVAAIDQAAGNATSLSSISKATVSVKDAFASLVELEARGAFTRRDADWLQARLSVTAADVSGLKAVLGPLHGPAGDHSLNLRSASRAGTSISVFEVPTHAAADSTLRLLFAEAETEIALNAPTLIMAFLDAPPSEGLLRALEKHGSWVVVLGTGVVESIGKVAALAEDLIVLSGQTRTTAKTMSEALGSYGRIETGLAFDDHEGGLGIHVGDTIHDEATVRQDEILALCHGEFLVAGAGDRKVYNGLLRLPAGHKMLPPVA